jgi:3',5'-cyclic AMP phosphodiesterase CpdA
MALIAFKLRMKNAYSFSVLLLLAMVFGCTGRHLTGSSPSFFIQLSDPQFGMFTGNKGFAQETINFEKAIGAVNRLHPAFVVVCGDLVNQDGNKNQIAEYQRIAAELDPSIPLYNVPGNHDVGNAPTEKSLSEYRKNFGADYYSFTSGDLFGIVLNSSLFFDPSLVPAEAEKQDQWLRRTLDSARKRRCTNLLIFQHIPWFVKDPDEKDEYANIPVARRRAYLDLFHEYGIKYVLAGHLHRNAIGRDGNLEIVCTGPVGMALGRDPSGLRVVRTNTGRLSWQYYGLDSIPFHIKF